MPVRITDLSQPLTPGMSVFPGDPTVAFETVATVPADGFRVSALHMGTHSGTHVDAPSHSIEGAAAIDDVDLTFFHGRARIVRVEDVEKQQRIEFDQVSAQLEGLAPGEIVIFQTDWSEHFNTSTYFEHPFLDAKIADCLVSQQVRTVGVDLLSPDFSPIEAKTEAANLPFHEIFLGAGGVIFENLTNLAAVTTRNPLFSAFPIRLVGLDGAPVRAVALGDF
ncbi:cyclase family protein [Rhodococcus marinonascens]|uniref:cyclase family protein n=1 Tax=Rhodococcus marinonascens TaxID=38311 RepID=UPI0009352013|nr:cyclase family protein [Rhodococcus marinonascens]